MWLSLSESFLSIVTPSGPEADPLQLLVRARVQGDIERVFPSAVVTTTPDRDYRYRTTLPRTVVAAALAAAVQNIDYTNFKSSVSDDDRHAAYFECWSAMHNLQLKKARAQFLRR